MLAKQAGRLRWFALSEDAWAKEVGYVRSELSEIDLVLADIGVMKSRLSGPAQNLIINAEKMIVSAKADLEAIGGLDVRHAPRRDPIALSRAPSPAQLSTDIGKLSVRVRNIGQDTADFENVNIISARQKLEKASDKIRKAFVEFEKTL